jgi:hypothetical protein
VVFWLLRFHRCGLRLIVLVFLAVRYAPPPSACDSAQCQLRACDSVECQPWQFLHFDALGGDFKVIANPTLDEALTRQWLGWLYHYNFEVHRASCQRWFATWGFRWVPAAIGFKARDFKTLLRLCWWTLDRAGFVPFAIAVGPLAWAMSFSCTGPLRRGGATLPSSPNLPHWKKLSKDVPCWAGEEEIFNPPIFAFPSSSEECQGKATAIREKKANLLADIERLDAELAALSVEEAEWVRKEKPARKIWDYGSNERLESDEEVPCDSPEEHSSRRENRWTKGKDHRMLCPHCHRCVFCRPLWRECWYSGHAPQTGPDGWKKKREAFMANDPAGWSAVLKRPTDDEERRNFTRRQEETRSRAAKRSVLEVEGIYADTSDAAIESQDFWDHAYSVEDQEGLDRLNQALPKHPPSGMRRHPIMSPDLNNAGVLETVRGYCVSAADVLLPQWGRRAVRKMVEDESTRKTDAATRRFHRAMLNTATVYLRTSDEDTRALMFAHLCGECSRKEVNALLIEAEGCLITSAMLAVESGRMQQLMQCTRHSPIQKTRVAS